MGSQQRDCLSSSFTGAGSSLTLGTVKPFDRLSGTMHQTQLSDSSAPVFMREDSCFCTVSEQEVGPSPGHFLLARWKNWRGVGEALPYHLISIHSSKLAPRWRCVC